VVWRSSVRMRDLLQVGTRHGSFIPQDDEACAGDEPVDEYVCKAGQCREAAGRILASMNLRNDPCRDFYKFACGGWSAGPDGRRQNLSSGFDQKPELSFNTLQKHVDQEIQRKSCVKSYGVGACTRN
jgi:hypothetical protein